MFPLIGVDSLLNSSEMIVIAGNSSQNSSVSGPFCYTLLYILSVFFFFSLQSGLEQERNIFADKA